MPSKFSVLLWRIKWKFPCFKKKKEIPKHHNQTTILEYKSINNQSPMLNRRRIHPSLFFTKVLNSAIWEVRYDHIPPDDDNKMGDAIG